MRIIIAVFISSFFASVADAQTEADTDNTNRKGYSLFKPVPKNKMGDMETDRPDVTESAYSVPAGHFQVESDLFRHVRNKTDGEQNITNTYNLANYKIGLNYKMDLQFVVPTYVSSVTRDVATHQVISRTSGFDDISIRLKYNLWGNGGGKTALAALPYVTLPTSSFANNGVQGGIVFPFALGLNDDWSFGSQVAAAVVREEDKKYYSELLYSFTFGRSITKELNGFVESYVNYSTFSKTADMFANGGLIFALSDNFNIDAGVNIGLNKGADKVYFLGFSFRR